MKAVLLNNGVKKPLQDLSFAQTKQAAAIMDCIGRLIPHEGVDYEVEIVFKSAYDPSVSLNITALTDKGTLWKEYLTKMIAKYPPVVDYHGDVLPDVPDVIEVPDKSQEQQEPKGDLLPDGQEAKQEEENEHKEAEG